MKHLFDARALLWRGPLLALLVVAGFVASPAHPASAATAALSVGSFHSCALTTAGGLKCWGENSDGRLGDGTTTDRSMPVDVSGLTSGVAAVSAGTNHTCALTAAGAVKCWGENSDGRLGDGTTTDRSTPVAVRGLTIGLVAVSVGSSHACALTKGGAAKCWGGELLWSAWGRDDRGPRHAGDRERAIQPDAGRGPYSPPIGKRPAASRTQWTCCRFCGGRPQLRHNFGGQCEVLGG